MSQPRLVFRNSDLENLDNRTNNNEHIAVSIVLFGAVLTWV
jgi:hypothetical protein